MAMDTSYDRMGSLWREIGPSGHACQVYSDDNHLLETLNGFIGGGLWAGESAVVIATDSHLVKLEARLRQTGLDLAHFRGDERYVPLSAELTLERFMVDGWPDAERFHSTIGDVMGRARRGGREVRCFGEMVALLWSQGLYGAAVRVEHLWNELIERKGFPLICAYSKNGFAKAGAERMAEVGAAHSRVFNS